MEILTQDTQYFEFALGLFLFGAGALFFSVIVLAVIAKCITDGVDSGDIVGTLVCAVIATFLWVAFSFTIAQGPNVIYKAKITDFNVVYEKGYEIVDNDGELYTIRESD